MKKNFKEKTVFPAPLKFGSHIRIIAPASSVKQYSDVPKAVKAFKDLGFKVSLSSNAKKRNSYLAGTDKERLDDLHAAFKDKSVDAILCLRGGYGTMRILDKIDYDLIKKNPKVLCGFSDITALHLAIFAKTKVGTFLGPNLLSFFKKENQGKKIFSELTLNSFLSSVTHKGANIQLLAGVTKKYKKSIKTVIPGIIKGRVIGGNLSLICALVGTDYLPDLKGSVLFIEEINEPAYRFDRLLTQLLLAGVLKGVKAIVLGQCTGCPQAETIFKERLKPLKIPLKTGFPFGHVDEMITIPLGRTVEIK